MIEAISEPKKMVTKMLEAMSELKKMVARMLEAISGPKKVESRVSCCETLAEKDVVTAMVFSRSETPDNEVVVTATVPDFCCKTLGDEDEATAMGFLG